MKNYLVLDIDNTVVGNSENSVNVEKRLEIISQFWNVIVATGRSFENFKLDYNWGCVDKNLYCGIFSNGGEIYNNGIKNNMFFDINIAKIVLKKLKESNYKATVQTDFCDIFTLTYFFKNSISMNRINRIKILNDEYKGDYAFLTLLSALNLQLIYFNGGSLTIMPAEVNKRSAVYKCIGKNIDKYKIVACGDGNNDLSLEYDKNITFIKTKDRGNKTFEYLYSRLKFINSEMD